jgi:uncharacterized repeat protein (TIGR01451 family)
MPEPDNTDGEDPFGYTWLQTTHPRGKRVRRLFIPLATVCTFLFLYCGVISAQQEKEPLKVAMTLKKIVVRDGVETMQSAETVKPGELAEYTVEYRNQSAKAVKGVLGNLPIPVGMTYEGGPATTKGVLASTDGKNFSATPLKRRQKNADGGETEVLVPLKEYRVLRWELGEIAPQTSKTVRARMRVISTAPATEPAKH